MKLRENDLSFFRNGGVKYEIVILFLCNDETKRKTQREYSHNVC